MKLSRSLDGALKLAVHSNLTMLTERINKIKEKRYLDEKTLQKPTNSEVISNYSSSFQSEAIDRYERNNPNIVDIPSSEQPRRKAVDFTLEPPMVPDVIKPVTIVKSRNPFAKSVQNSSISIETRTDMDHPLDAVAMLMKKKDVIPSGKRKAQTQTSLLKTGIMIQLDVINSVHVFHKRAVKRKRRLLRWMD